MGYWLNSVGLSGPGSGRRRHLLRRASGGMSLVEIVVAISVLAVLVSVGISFSGAVTSSTRDSKLETDTMALNRAVTMYIASGGDLTGAGSPSAVLAKLKTTSSVARIKTQINPLTSSLVDPRLDVVLQNNMESLGREPRVYWNASDQQFEVKTSGGAGGVKMFQLSNSAVPAQIEIDARKSGAMEFATNSGWIWDFKDDWDTSAGPSAIPTFIPLVAIAPTPPVAPTPSPVELKPPSFSLPGGQFPATDFSLSVSLSNPNPVASSHLSYSIDGGAWQNYSGPLSLSPGDRVLARAISDDASRWQDSSINQEVYTAVLIDLAAPDISLSSNMFTATSPNITVTLTDNNAAGLSDLYFSLKDPADSYPPVQLWRRYNRPLSASVIDYPDGFDVITYAKAKDPNLHEHSDDKEAKTGADFFGVPVTDNVLLVIDASSSMNSSFGGGKTRFEAVIEAAVQVIPNLRPRQKFNVAMFDAGVHWTDGTFELHNATSPFSPRMAALIQTVSTGSGTNYKAGLGLPMQYTPVPDRVIFLTDGEPDGTDYSNELNQLANAGVTVNVLGIELNSNARRLVEAIATATNGSVHEISRP